MLLSEGYTYDPLETNPLPSSRSILLTGWVAVVYFYDYYNILWTRWVHYFFPLVKFGRIMSLSYRNKLIEYFIYCSDKDFYFYWPCFADYSFLKPQISSHISNSIKYFLTGTRGLRPCSGRVHYNQQYHLIMFIARGNFCNFVIESG